MRVSHVTVATAATTSVLATWATILGSIILLLTSLMTSAFHPPPLFLHPKKVIGQRWLSVIPTSSISCLVLNAKSPLSNDDEDEGGEDSTSLPKSQQRRDGMAQAFRELESLTSLGSSSQRPTTPQKATSTPLVKIVETTTTAETTKSDKIISPEEEVKLYANMVQEVEENNDNDMYSTLLTEMGGTTDAAVSSPSSSLNPSLTDSTTTTSSRRIITSSLSSSQEQLSPIDQEAWMNQALQEALEEAKDTSSSLSNLDPQSVLNDKQLMQEIEQVFDQAHAKLLASLDEIRTEQAQWTAVQQQQQQTSSASSLTNSQVGQEYLDSTERLAKAESTLSTLLDKVQKETQSVQDAVQDLERAKQEYDDNPLVQLRQASVVKQATLVGALLFTMRTIGFIVSSSSSGSFESSPDSLVGILLQAAIAVVFAVAYIAQK